MTERRRYALVLAVYFNTRGFAFVLFEGPYSPFDWGVTEARGNRRQQHCMKGVLQILSMYAPDVLVVQDTSASGTLRAWRITRLHALAMAAAEERGIPVYSYSRAQVYEVFRRYGFSNKQMLAEVIAKHIPAFERYVPPQRKPWMSEDTRMGLFDAAALGLVFFQREKGKS